MNYNLLESLGLGSFDLSYVLIGMAVVLILLVILYIVQIVKTNQLKKKLNKFMQGKNAKSLEKEVLDLFESNEYIKEITDENRKEITKLTRNMEYAFQKIGLVRYNAFSTMGGMLSFSLALLNNYNSGFIMNSVHSSDGCYSYTKEIKEGKCEIDLGEEEKQALSMAVNGNKRKMVTKQENQRD